MELEQSYEFKLALAGIAFAVVALGGLAIYQQFRQKRESKDKIEAFRAAAVGAADAPPGGTPFFVARFRGNKPRFFRVYIDKGALLFLNAGPYFAMVDAETARGRDSRHWLLQAGNVLLAGLAGGAVIAVAALAMLGRAVAHSAADNPDGAVDIMQIVLGVIAFVAVMFLIIAPGVVWRVVQRGGELSALPLSGLREQAEAHPLSFKATRENVSGIKIKRLDADTKNAISAELAATLTFKHKPTGNWNIETTKTPDTEQAIREFQRLLGPEAVALDNALKHRLPADLKGTTAGDEIEKSIAAAARFPIGETPALKTTNPPRFGFPLYMLSGFVVGAGVAVIAAFGLAPQGRVLEYTTLVNLVFSLGGLGLYLGHMSGALRNKDSGIEPFGTLSLGVCLLGTAILLIGSTVVFGAVMGIMSAILGPPPH